MLLLARKNIRLLVAACAGLVALMLAGQALAAEPAGPGSSAKAEALQAIGLFQGSDRGFELEREPTRAEAIAMLIRLLGKEEEAMAAHRSGGAPEHPFTDVPAWAQAYVDYAWQHQLTLGVSATRFGASQPVSSAQYLTFVLRALGFDDSRGDFDWRQAAEKAAAIGLVTDGDYKAADGVFLRAHLVDISYGALAVPMNNGDHSLLRRLIDDGQVDEAAAQRAGLAIIPGQRDASPAPPADRGSAAEPERRSVIVPVVLEYEAGEYGAVRVDREALLRELPRFERVKETVFIIRSVERTESEWERLVLLGLLMKEMGVYSPGNEQLGAYIRIQRPTYAPSPPFAEPGYELALFQAYGFMDADNRLIAYTTLEDLDMDKRTWTIHSYTDERVLDERNTGILDEARQLMTGAVYLTHEYANPEESARSVPVELQPEQRESRTVMPDGSERVEQLSQVVIERSALPPSVRAFSHKSGVGIWWTAARPHTAADFVRMPLMSRLSYLLYRDGQVDSTGMHYMPWTEQSGDLFFPARDSSGDRPGAIFSFLEDDRGNLLAYTSFYYKQD